ncbi:hypothetical protein E2C01_046120 [Portunus trituberculatus]|uniref:Uncharacterized protein n=1 Tax=Portunus trituberculatus TaxID=210409 RepID=A0A5B7G3T5_PORTR|nr:hypothetical protein [Portunus trituberculatus]
MWWAVQRYFLVWSNRAGRKEGQQTGVGHTQQTKARITKFPPQHATNEFPRRPPTAHQWPRLLLLLLLLSIAFGAYHNIPI